MRNSKQETYKLLRDAYNGSGGFEDGSYLLRHPREANEKYQMRKKLAYYLNYTRPCVDARVKPIFKTLAVREWQGTGSALWESFLEDADMAGTRLMDFMERVASISSIQGVAFIVMDRLKEASTEGTMASMKEDRRNLPYVLAIEPLDVKEIKVNRFGVITKFVYEEADEADDEKKAERTLTADGWELKNSRNEITKGTWNLGITPVIPVYSKLHDIQSPFPASDFLNIAQTNRTIYNLCSWLTDILVNQTFSVLVYPSNNTDGLVLGTSNALGFPSDASHMPTFIAPPDGPANILQGVIERLQQEEYRMSGVVNVTGVRSQASGVAKAWDFEQTNELLSNFADRIENAEQRISELFKRWMPVDLTYTVNYPNDYSISDVQTELANADVAKGLLFGDAFNLEVFKRVLTSYLPELSNEQFDQQVKAYEEELSKRTTADALDDNADNSGKA